MRRGSLRLPLAGFPHDPLDLGEVSAEVASDVASQAIVLVALLAGGACQPLAVPTTEVASVRRQIQFAHSPPAGSAIDNQWADEP